MSKELKLPEIETAETFTTTGSGRPIVQVEFGKIIRIERVE